ncbi:MAG: hypothetical protein E2O68_04305 [Deltaproteobacteria bacterium]|nr:MAG: hypothetical protein E2O68_04305 [Deltaproteobacteria bacterium]
MKNSLLRDLSYYVFYNLVTLVSITIIVSLITFFHFLLDHSIEAIESWISDNGWGLITASKLIALFIVMKFHVLNKNDKPTFKKLTLDHFIFPKKEFYPILLAFIGLFFVLESVNFVVGEFELDNVIKSFFYAFLFYFSDLFLLAQISSNGKTSRLKNFLYPLIFVIIAKTSFLLITVSDEKGQLTLLITYLNMVLLMFISGLNRENKFSLLAPLIFLIFYICPIISIFGLDPVWGDSRAVMTLKIIPYLKNYIVFSLLILCYLYLKNFKYKENYGIE